MNETCSKNGWCPLPADHDGFCRAPESWQQESDRAAYLWQSIGAIHALANPEGFIAARLGQSAEQRISQIWEILQTIKP